MSIEDDATTVLCALAQYEKKPDDSERGHHALEGEQLVAASGLRDGRLQDAVDVLDEREMITRHKFIGDAIGNIRLNARGRQEAERIGTARRGANADGPVEKTTSSDRVDKALAHRRELLEDLYRLDEESPGASGGWNAGDPNCMSRAREAEYLRVKGFVSGSIGADGGVSVRLTPSGRDYVEGGGFWSKQDAPAAPTTVVTASASQPKLPRLDVTYGEKLGSGAFGTVWQARDQLLDREIAVKFLTSTDQALDEDALLREARSLAKLAHQNLVRVYGAAWLRHPMTGLVAPAITMELLAGQVLETWWSRQHSRDAAFAVIAGFLSGVRAMHAAGLHHGDLHPRNVMVLVDGSPKIIDWRYQDTFLLQSTAHRSDLIESEQRRAIDLVISILEKQGHRDESVAIRGATDVGAVATVVQDMALRGVVRRTSQQGLSAVDAERERTLQLRKLEAEARILGRLISNARNLGANDPEITLQIENLGRSGFAFDTCEWRVEWNQGFHNQLAKYNVVMPEGYVPPRGRLPVSSGPLLPSGRSMEFRFKWTRLDALAHFRDAKVEVPGFNGAWADYHFEVACRGELGGEEVLHWTERPMTTP